MDEEEARDWLRAHPAVSRETFDRLERFADFLREENGRQNLVSKESLAHLWARHFIDSAQLLRFAPRRARWADLGSGAGFPGLLVALLHDGPVTLIEARRLRVDFLRRAAALLGLDPVILQDRVETVKVPPFDVISARAFAPLGRLLAVAHPLSTAKTVWILPKGRKAQTELEAVRSSWQGDFRLEPSMTDPSAGIIVASGIGKRGRK